MKHLDRVCPHCGKSWTRSPMEVDPNAPGLLDILHGKAGTAKRWILTVVLVILVSLFLISTKLTFF